MDKKELVSRCAEMFERYYDRLSGKMIHTECIHWIQRIWSSGKQCIS